MTISRLMGAMGFAAVLSAAATTAAFTRDSATGGDDQYPYSIMKPEPGTTRHRQGSTVGHAASAAKSSHPSLLGREKFVGKLHRRPGTFVSRGSSGSVLPTPLPRTSLIPPEGADVPTTHPLPETPGPSFVPGTARPIPNLPHGPETFQDRASRCSMQSGLFNVPGAVRNQYMGSCVN